MFTFIVDAALKEPCVVGPCDFHAHNIQINLPRSQMLSWREAPSAIVHVSLQPNVACIAFPTREGEPVTVHGVKVVIGNVIFWPPGTRFHVRTPAGSAFACILFNPKKLTRGYLATEDEPTVLPKAYRLAAPLRSPMRRLLRLHLRATHAARMWPHVLRDKGTAGELERLLFESAAECLGSETLVLGRRLPHSRLDIMNRFEDVLRQKPECLLSISELHAALGVPPRTLRACCHEHLGMGPSQYLTLRRRNQLRSAPP